MSIMMIFLSGCACVLLQTFSKNLIFMFIGLTGMYNAIALSYFYDKEKRFLCWPAICINLIIAVCAVMLHLSYGNIINDYLWASILPVLFNLLTIIEIIPFKKRLKTEV